LKILHLNFLKYTDINEIDNVLLVSLSKTNFIFALEQTNKYRNSISKDQSGFVIEKINDDNNPLFFFNSFVKNKFELVNIVPLNNDIEEEEYDELISEIYDVIKGLNIKNLKMNCFDNAKDLSKIITSKTVREKFENIIEYFPNSYHPNDLKEMDVLTCIIHSRSRKEIDFDILEKHLNKYYNLEKDYIKYLLNRIKIGLQVLSVYTNKKYYL
jgi:hypothetical protein